MPSSSPGNPGAWHTPEDAARRYKVHINTIYNYISAGLLGHSRLNRLIRISDADFAEFESRTTEESRRRDDEAINGDCDGAELNDDES